MLVRYYILPDADGYNVLREGKIQGRHPTKQRALDAAVFMATVEANNRGHIGEVFVEDDFGRMMQQLVVGPREATELTGERNPVVRRIGHHEYLVSA